MKERWETEMQLLARYTERQVKSCRLALHTTTGAIPVLVTLPLFSPQVLSLESVYRSGVVRIGLAREKSVGKKRSNILKCLMICVDIQKSSQTKFRAVNLCFTCVTFSLLQKQKILPPIFTFRVQYNDLVLSSIPPSCLKLLWTWFFQCPALHDIWLGLGFFFGYD